MFPAPPIAIAVEDQCSVLRLAGALGVNDAESLRQAALDLCARGCNVRVDWTAVERIDCSVLQVLVALRARLTARGLSLDAARLPDSVAAYLETAGFPLSLAKADVAE
jgi:anti-anti-sigma factor